MKNDTASHTARIVAAHRLTYARIETPYGDPAADDALARDVAGDLEPPSGRMHDYLRVRTSFFDHIVVTSIDRGSTQVVVGAAGYDGRALRYKNDGVRWFEIDHPATQADKTERLARLGIDTGHIRFVAADFTADPVADLLARAGLDARKPALFLLEGIAVYLPNDVLERVAGQFRLVTRKTAALAISVSTTSDAQARARFQGRVAEFGEPAQSFLDADSARDLLARAGWRVAPPDGSRQAQRSAAGLLVAHAAGFSSERSLLTPAPSPAS